MKRREFITLAGGAVAAWPLPARAQQPAMPVIAYFAVTSGHGVGEPALAAAFRRGLAEACYVEGKDVTIEDRFANFKLELLPQIAGDLVHRNVNVIFAATPPTVVAARNATTSIPIVAVDLESDPLAKGYVKSLARPGGNMTGMFLDLPELSGKPGGEGQLYTVSLLEQLRGECQGLWGASSKAYFRVDRLLRQLADPNLHDSPAIYPSALMGAGAFVG